MALVYVALGSNMGDRLANIRSARRALAALPETVLLNDAPVYETKPVGGPAGQDLYYNSASVVETRLEPLDFLRELLAVERRHGRERGVESAHWGPRPLDLDIIFWGDMVIEEADLTVPHPRMAERMFVLAPLADLDADFVHPVLDLTVRELLERMDADNEGIRRLPV